MSGLDSGDRFDRDIERQAEIDGRRLLKKKGPSQKIRDFLTMLKRRGQE